jgi:hypothetical protein
MRFHGICAKLQDRLPVEKGPVPAGDAGGWAGGGAAFRPAGALSPEGRKPRDGARSATLGFGTAVVWALFFLIGTNA